MANERSTSSKQGEQQYSPHRKLSNGQWDGIQTQVWDNRVERYGRSIDRLIAATPMVRTTLFYVPAWQPEATQYMVTNGTMPSQLRVQLANGTYVRISIKATPQN